MLEPREPGAAHAVTNRILAPLDGRAGSEAALNELVRLAADARAEILVAHVYEERCRRSATTSRTRCAHGAKGSSPATAGRPVRRSSCVCASAHQHVLDIDILRHSGCDLVALDWSQDLARGPAAVVRRIVADSPVPVLPAACRDAVVSPLAADAAAGRSLSQPRQADGVPRGPMLRESPDGSRGRRRSWLRGHRDLDVAVLVEQREAGAARRVVVEMKRHL